MPRKNISNISVYLNPEVKAGLKAWSESEQRTLSSLCAHLLTKAYEEYEQQDKQK